MWRGFRKSRVTAGRSNATRLLLIDRTRGDTVDCYRVVYVLRVAWDFRDRRRQGTTRLFDTWTIARYGFNDCEQLFDGGVAARADKTASKLGRSVHVVGSPTPVIFTSRPHARAHLGSPGCFSATGNLVSELLLHRRSGILRGTM